MQKLAATAHQALAAGRAAVPVGGVGASKLPQSLDAPLIETIGRCRQLSGQIVAELLAAALQIDKATLSLQLQSLLQRANPNLNR